MSPLLKTAIAVKMLNPTGAGVYAPGTRSCARAAWADEASMTSKVARVRLRPSCLITELSWIAPGSESQSSGLMQADRFAILARTGCDVHAISLDRARDARRRRFGGRAKHHACRLTVSLPAGDRRARAAVRGARDASARLPRRRTVLVRNGQLVREERPLGSGRHLGGHAGRRPRHTRSASWSAGRAKRAASTASSSSSG